MLKAAESHIHSVSVTQNLASPSQTDTTIVECQKTLGRRSDPSDHISAPGNKPCCHNDTSCSIVQKDVSRDTVKGKFPFLVESHSKYHSKPIESNADT